MSGATAGGPFVSVGRLTQFSGPDLGDLCEATEIDSRRAGAVPSTKGTLSGSLKC